MSIKAGELTPTMMSKRQRQNLLVEKVKLPKYLKSEIMERNTLSKSMFLNMWMDMVDGNIDFDPDGLATLRDRIAMERLRVK